MVRANMDGEAGTIRRLRERKPVPPPPSPVLLGILGGQLQHLLYSERFE